MTASLIDIQEVTKIFGGTRDTPSSALTDVRASAIAAVSSVSPPVRSRTTTVVRLANAAISRVDTGESGLSNSATIAS